MLYTKVTGGDKENYSDWLSFDVGHVMHTFDNHKRTWGFTKRDTATKANQQLLIDRIKSFVDKGATSLYGGCKFGREEAMVFYDSSTGRFVATGLNYNFLNGYVLKPNQIRRFLRTGRIKVRF
jgi:hypothetical protein